MSQREIDESTSIHNTLRRLENAADMQYMVGGTTCIIGIYMDYAVNYISPDSQGSSVKKIGAGVTK